MDETTQVKPSYEEEIAKIIRGDALPKMQKDQLLNYHENDIADALDIMNVTERQRLYRILDQDDLAAVFEYLEKDKIVLYLEEMDLRKKSALVSGMEADKAVNVLRQMDKKEREMMLTLMDDSTKKEIELIASFDDDQIGSKMTTNFISIPISLSVKEAMKELIRQAEENDNISTIYTVDEDNVFCGAITLKDLIIARQNTNLEDLVMTSYPFVYGREDIDDCIEWLKDYSEDSIPALDEENRILGVITAQEIIKVVDDEMGEDYAKLAGLAAEEDLNEPVKESIKKRLPWLIALLGLGLVVSSVVGMFEKVVAQLTIIMAFQSLILDMAGNVGTQSLAVTIRVLMDEQLTGMQKVKLVLKEARVGLSNGLILGIMSTVLVGLYIHFAKDYPVNMAFAISACIGVSLMAAMVVSSLVGTLIPMFFKKIGVDPAVASGPLITTVNDLVAVITYYGLAWLFLIQLAGAV